MQHEQGPQRQTQDTPPQERQHASGSSDPTPLGEAMQKFVTGVGAKREHSQIEGESDQEQEHLLEVRRRSAHTEQYNIPLQQNLLTTAAVGMNAPG